MIQIICLIYFLSIMYHVSELVQYLRSVVFGKHVFSNWTKYMMDLDPSWYVMFIFRFIRKSTPNKYGCCYCHWALWYVMMNCNIPHHTAWESKMSGLGSQRFKLVFLFDVCVFESPFIFDPASNHEASVSGEGNFHHCQAGWMCARLWPRGLPESSQWSDSGWRQHQGWTGFFARWSEEGSLQGQD